LGLYKVDLDVGISYSCNYFISIVGN